MVGKIRLPKKATKGKGKIWRKGQSSSFNPQFRKFRIEAKRRALYGYQVEGNLTKKALEKLDALNGDQIVQSDDDATSIGDKSFVTTFSDCSNPTFSRMLKNWHSNSLIQKEMLAVLAAVTDVIKSKGGKETETEYFAALMTTLSAVDTDEGLSAVVSLLYMIIKKLPIGVRRLKFSDSCEIFVDLLKKYMNSDFNALLRNLLGCLHLFLKSQEPGEWADSTSKMYNVLLEFAIHQKPKVRKAAQEAVFSILCGSGSDKENVTVCHPAALSTAQFCMCTVQSCATVGQESPLTFHVLGLLKDVIGTFPRANVKSCCETVLRVMTLSNVMITSVCLKVFYSLFSSRIRSDNLPPELNAKLVSALYDYQPNINDGQPLVDWLYVMEKALCNLYSSDEKLCISHLPNFFNAAVKCWASNQSEVRSAVAVSLKNILTCCIEPSKPEFQRLLLANPLDNPMSKMFHAIEGALSYQYHLAWKEVLLVLATFFDVAGKHLYPIMLKCLQSLADLRDTFKFSHIAELDKTIGVAIHRMGPKVVLQAIPLLITGENDKMNFPRSWLLPLLRDNVKDTELGFFIKYFLPLAAKIRSKVLQLEKENKVIEGKTYSIIWIQIWSVLPGFCTNPTDLKQSFSGIAKILGTALRDEKDLKTYILSALRLLITKNLDNEENRMEMAAYAKNYLPILFNLYTTEVKEKLEERHRLAVFDTMKVYLQITDKAQCIAFFDKAMEKLSTPDLDEFMQHSLMDITRSMLAYMDTEHIKALCGYCQPLLEHLNHTVQKKAYSVLKELCSSESENCNTFVKKNLEKLKSVLLTSLSASSPSSKALRLICIEHIIHQLKEDEVNKNFIVSVVPEAVLCTKENSTRARGAAFSLLVQIGRTLKQWRPDDPKGALQDYMQMLLAGLAGGPHLISATILAIGQVMFEFKDDLSSDIITLLIENMCLLLTSRSREVVDSALSFVKVLFASVDTMGLAQHVQYLVQNIVSISEDHQRHFRFKAKEIFTRLIRKFGYELISKMVPSGYQKQLANIRKLESRKARSKEMKKVYDENDNDTPRHKGKSDSIEDILEDSDEEMPEESMSKSPMKFSKRPKKQVNAPWIEEQDENDIVDLLDPTVNRKILSTKPKSQNAEENPKPSKTFPTAPDGRLIIREEEEEDKGKKRRKPSEDADVDELELESKKRKLEDLSDDEYDTGSSKYQHGGKGIHRSLSKQDSGGMLGKEYKAKKAGGDVKKGKFEPFAYFPLNKQTLNKRKRGKLAGQFKGVVKAAKRGAEKGTKAKAMLAKRKK